MRCCSLSYLEFYCILKICFYGKLELFNKYLFKNSNVILLIKISNTAHVSIDMSRILTLNELQ